METYYCFITSLLHSNYCLSFNAPQLLTSVVDMFWTSFGCLQSAGLFCWGGGGRDGGKTDIKARIKEEALVRP